MSYQLNDPARFTNTVLRSDSEVDGILTRIAEDMRVRPDMMVPLSSALADRVAELTDGIELDPRDPIEGAVDLSI